LIIFLMLMFFLFYITNYGIFSSRITGQKQFLVLKQAIY